VLEGEEPLAQITLGATSNPNASNTYRIVRSQEYQEVIEHLEQTLKNILEDTTLKDLVGSLQSILKLKKIRLKVMCPGKIKARGLIKGLGSAVKPITGCGRCREI